LLLALSLCASAKPPTDSTEIYLKAIEHFKDSVNKALTYSTGKIKPEGGHVMLNVPEGFKYLNKEQSKFVLTKLWGNPEESSSEVIGMIFPQDSGPFGDSSYAFVITYEEIGYVKDEDAGKLNYDDLLKDIQKDEKAENEKRVKAGYPAVHLVGWAQKPYYDGQRKILHWAKELKFGEDSDANTLNYEIRILGRKGMLSLNAVGKMYDLPLVNKDISKVLNVASFTEGNSYFDFNPKVDNVAAWTIGGLVAGKLLAKAGLFALIAKFLAPLWKFIMLAFVGVGAWFKRRLGLKKDAGVREYHSEEPAEHADEAVQAHADETIQAEGSNHTGAEGHGSTEAEGQSNHVDSAGQPQKDGETDVK
jgi:uncharacterized membrane-anchored protein